MGIMTDKLNKNRKVIIRPDGSVKIISENGTDTKTDQSFKDTQNINSIMRRYSALGYDYAKLPDATKGAYGDFTKVKSYEQALQMSLDVKNAFMKLPSEIRKRFYNDPQKLNDFMMDPKNQEEAIKIGLLQKKAQPEPVLNNPIPTTPEPK